MDLNQTIGATLAPVTKEIVAHKVKQKDFENRIVRVELKDTNRPDLWSTVGLGRHLRGYIGEKQPKKNSRIILMTTKAKKNYNTFKFKKGDTILFGRESAGVPKKVHDNSFERLKIPLKKNSRSLKKS